jgi:hypothetical protein
MGGFDQQRFAEALCRTRTGDPFLTMGVRRTRATSATEPKSLHAQLTERPQGAASMRMFGTPPYGVSTFAAVVRSDAASRHSAHLP